MYYNIEASTPNPPSLTLGTWVENTAVTQSLCGVINSMTGDLQDITLESIDFQIERDNLKVYPNPVKNTLKIKYLNMNINNVSLYNTLGRLQVSRDNTTIIDISSLSSGVYFVKIEIEKKAIVKKVVVD